MNKKAILDAHYEYRKEKGQHEKGFKEYYVVLLALVDTPWWKVWWVLREMMGKMKNGQI